MPSILPFLPAIIGAGASVAGSMLGSGSKTVKTTTTLPPELQTAQNTDLSTLQSILQSPDSGLAPIKAASQDQINRNYAQMPQLATQKLAARGFGSSGDVGKAVYDTEGARLGDLSGLEGQMAQLTSNRQLTASQIIQQIIAAGRGQNTTYPSNMGSAGLTAAGSGLGSLSALIMLQHMINGGGGFDSAGAGGLLGPGLANAVSNAGAGQNTIGLLDGSGIDG